MRPALNGEGHIWTVGVCWEFRNDLLERVKGLTGFAVRDVDRFRETAWTHPDRGCGSIRLIARCTADLQRGCVI